MAGDNKTASRATGGDNRSSQIVAKKMAESYLKAIYWRQLKDLI